MAPDPTDHAGVTADIWSDHAIDIAFRAGGWPHEPALRDLVERAVGQAAAGLADHLPGQWELSVAFTDDAEIRNFNARYRGRDVPTNVLSFPAPDIAGLPRMLGDIILARETILAEAKSRGLTCSHHITHLVVHGFLHLLDFDHGNDAEAEKMELLETAILARLGIADPYAEPDGSPADKDER